MTIVDVLATVVLGSLLRDLMGGKSPGPARPVPGPAKPPAPHPTTPTESKPPAEPKPLPKEPSAVPWPSKPPAPPPAASAPAKVPGDMAPVRTPEESKKDVIPPGRQPRPVPNPESKAAAAAGVKTQQGQAVSQTEEAAVIAREHSPGRPYWRPRARPSADEVKVAVAMLPKWKKGQVIYAGPRTFTGRRMFLHTIHAPNKKAVEVWEPAPPFV